MDVDNKKYYCICCGEEYNIEEMSITDYGEERGEPICEECMVNDIDVYGTPIYHCNNGHRTKYMLGLYKGMDEYGDSIEEDNKILDFIPSWISLDSWRGYYSANPKDKWARVIDDWFGIDGHNITGRLEKFHKKWEINKENAPFEMVVSFPKTSNCCTCGIQIYVKKEDEELFDKWIDE